MKSSSLLAQQVGPSKPAIDDFLDRLLGSAKFDVLADKIAEKAVDKIIQNLSQDSGRNIGKPRVQAVQNHDEENVEPQVPTTDNHMADNVNKGRVFKINSEALDGKYATISLDDISLNFKRFTHENKQMKEKATPKTYISNENEMDKHRQDHNRDSGEQNNRFDDHNDGKGVHISQSSDAYQSEEENYNNKKHSSRGDGFRSFKHRAEANGKKSHKTKFRANTETTKFTNSKNGDSGKLVKQRRGDIERNHEKTSETHTDTTKATDYKQQSSNSKEESHETKFHTQTTKVNDLTKDLKLVTPLTGDSDEKSYEEKHETHFKATKAIDIKNGDSLKSLKQHSGHSNEKSHEKPFKGSTSTTKVTDFKHSDDKFILRTGQSDEKREERKSKPRAKITQFTIKHSNGLKSFKQHTIHSEEESHTDTTKVNDLKYGDETDEKSVEVTPQANKETTKSRDLVNKDSTESDSDNNKLPHSGNTRNSDVDTRSIIRKQGDKLYAFQDSPDYDEYHNSLSHLLNSARKRNKERSRNTSTVEK